MESKRRFSHVPIILEKYDIAIDILLKEWKQARYDKMRSYSLGTETTSLEFKLPLKGDVKIIMEKIFDEKEMNVVKKPTSKTLILVRKIRNKISLIESMLEENDYDEFRELALDILDHINDIDIELNR